MTKLHIWPCIQGRKRRLMLHFHCQRQAALWGHWRLMLQYDLQRLHGIPKIYMLQQDVWFWAESQRPYLSQYAHVSYNLTGGTSSSAIQWISTFSCFVAVRWSSPSVQQQHTEKVAHQATPMLETPRSYLSLLQPRASTCSTPSPHPQHGSNWRGSQSWFARSIRSRSLG